MQVIVTTNMPILKSSLVDPLSSSLQLRGTQSWSTMGTPTPSTSWERVAWLLGDVCSTTSPPAPKESLPPLLPSLLGLLLHPPWNTPNHIPMLHTSKVAAFNSLISCQHPSLWKFLDSLRNQQALSDNTRQRIRGCSFKPSQMQATRNTRIENLIAGYTDIFLRGIAFNYMSWMMFVVFLLFEEKNLDIQCILTLS